jgi:hypothetical protein
MLLKLFLVRVLTPCTPVVGVLSFFSPRAPVVFLRQEYDGNFTHFQGSCCGAVYFFSPFSERAEFLLFGQGVATLLQFHWGVLSLCALWGRGFLTPAE